MESQISICETEVIRSRMESHISIYEIEVKEGITYRIYETEVNDGINI